MDEPSHGFVGDGLRIRRGQLPHWQQGGGTYFVTFRSARGLLPDKALAIAKAQILEGHGARYDLAFGVLMPDHVHLLIRPFEFEPGRWWDLSEIMKGIKGASARRINQGLGLRGSVWQKESFDRVVRDDAEFQKHWQYMYFNPRKAGLVVDPEEYPWFIRPPVDSMFRVSGSGQDESRPTEVGPRTRAHQIRAHRIRTYRNHAVIIPKDSGRLSPDP